MASTSDTVFWSDNEYEIRPARNTDEFRNVWWGFMQVLRWNRGYYDLDTYMNPSEGSGMFLLIEQSSGKCVGHVAAVINPNSTGWASMFIIDEKHQGKGLGRQLFKAAEADFERHGTKIKGLDGVVVQRQTYERRRFVVSPLGEVQIMMRPLVAKAPATAASTSGQVVDIRTIPQQLLVRHELKYTGFERPALWSDKHMFHRKDVDGVAVISKEGPDSIDDLRAWAVIRRCSGGVRIGPVYASDPESARAVIVAAMEKATPQAIGATPLPNEAMNDWSEDKIAQEASLVTEVWDGNPEALKLFKELGWNEAPVSYYRMWVDGVATPEQSEGGAAQEGVYAIFDAAIG